MLNALYIAATGLQAEQQNVESISNNLSNMNTPVYKKSRVQFSDLVGGVQSMQPTAPAATAASAGLGVGVSATQKMFDAGQFQETDSPYDLAIRGDGFFEVVLPDGTSAYSRGGTLKVNSDGMLATQDGYPLKASISVPADAQSISIGSDGTVQIISAGDSTPTEAGQIELVRFASEGDLTPLGSGLYQPNDQSGDALTLRPGENGSGLLAQGYVEQSNVNMVDEMVNLMVAQRGYQANAKLVQAADDMLSTVNGLRR
ncbi:flagellar basal-body rod protein FlgG [Paraburkholderia ferrariae]|uniref:Flagellar basal-body rod protein FlgG n=1 Tax=Paraburkholderia ferrariae TaxID=386056 RepID=A0ABU9RMF2_9BURK